MEIDVFFEYHGERPRFSDYIAGFLRLNEQMKTNGYSLQIFDGSFETSTGDAVDYYSAKDEVYEAIDRFVVEGYEKFMCDSLDSKFSEASWPDVYPTVKAIQVLFHDGGKYL